MHDPLQVSMIFIKTMSQPAFDLPTYTKNRDLDLEPFYKFEAFDINLEKQPSTPGMENGVVVAEVVDFRTLNIEDNIVDDDSVVAEEVVTKRSVEDDS